jgi:acetyl esterase/lipase
MDGAMIGRCVRGFAGVPLVVVWFMSAAPGTAQVELGEAGSWAGRLASEYRIVPAITYLTADGWESELDLYLPRSPIGPTPTVIYFHGGFWVRGSRTASSLNVIPYLEMGWAVVNVSYRLGSASLAPAAVEDALCALRWVIRNAGEYDLDPGRIVATGHSAGGHLALSTAMIPPSAGLDARCAGDEPLSVAGVINWYGPTDVPDLLDGPNRQNLVVEWFGSRPDRFELAEWLSPITYVRAALPPILTIHGTEDRAVPYDHAARLHRALDDVGSPNRLHTVEGGGHGGFSGAELDAIFQHIRNFLEEVEGNGTP